MMFARTVLAALLACSLFPLGARAGDRAIEPAAAWSVQGDFEKGEEARTNLVRRGLHHQDAAVPAPA